MSIMSNSSDGSMTTFDKWRMIYGFMALVIAGAIIICIALGKVEEKTSYGLLPALTMLSVVLGGFANWAFSKGKDSAELAELKAQFALLLEEVRKGRAA